MRALKPLLLLIPCLALAGPKRDLEGPVSRYEKDAVILSGKRHFWKDLASFTESAPEGKRPEEAPDEVWTRLIRTLAKDGYDKAAVAEMRKRLAPRWPSVLLSPPFEGRWKASVDETKHHQAKCWTLWAIDFLKVDGKGRFLDGDPYDLESFYGWGQTVYAAADGVVTQAQDGFPDLPSQELGKAEEANTISIRHGDAEFTDYAHLQKGSILVKVGDKVKRGQPIAKVGNSGKSGSPHLHFALTIVGRSEDGTGAWLSVPFVFEGFRAFGVDMKRARPQEGWILECPKPE